MTEAMDFLCHMVSDANPTTVLIADDHVIIRRGLRNLLSGKYPHLSVSDVSSWGDLERALERGVPNVLVLDLQLGDRNAMDLLHTLRARYPKLRILVYSMNPEHIYGQRVLAMGCNGYLTKESSEEEVLRAMAKVLEGGTYMSHAMEMRMIEAPGNEEDLTEPGSPFGRLSDRELRVMEQVLQGRGVKEIAASMDLSPSTVATYKARVFDKLGVTNLVDLQELVKVHAFPIRTVP